MDDFTPDQQEPQITCPECGGVGLYEDEVRLTITGQNSGVPWICNATQFNCYNCGVVTFVTDNDDEEDDDE